MSLAPATLKKSTSSKMSDSEDDDCYGPSLPPGFSEQKRKRSPSASSAEDDSYGPALPVNIKQKQTNNIIGPILPSHLQKPTTHSSDSEPDSDSDSDSESDSKSRKKQKLLVESHNDNTSASRNSIIGPSIPSDITQIDSEPKAYSEHQISSEHQVSDDESDIGPSLYLKASESDQTTAAKDFENRAQKMKNKLEGKGTEEEGPKARESWMTELPSNMGVKFGLENRQFRKNAAPEQDSSWTETPQDKEKREKEGQKPAKQPDLVVPDERGQAMAKEIDKYNKQNRPESLLEMHQKKMKKEKKKEKKREKKEKKKSKKKDKDKDKEKPNERQPFDREVDLQVNRLDEAQKRAIIKRSQELGSRFKTGGMGTSFL